VAENDPDTLIRPPAIRGHLRFWWRAIRGAQFETAAELAEAEGKIWGTTSEPSRIDVTATVTNAGMSEDAQTFDSRGHLGYVLFPFQPKDGKPATRCTRNIKFTLNIQYSGDLALEIKAAVWGWTNFGGIGARTRRGCGALFCNDLAPQSARHLSTWLQMNKAEFGLTEHKIRPWPTLGTMYATSESDLAERAWTTCVDVLYRFRQGDIGRNPSQGGTPGRSRWPEADSLRAITGQANSRHAQPITLPNPKQAPAFPRAAFGLPIVFHFKDKQDPSRELYPDWNESTRMASPLILRPLGFGDGSKALPMIVRLRAPGPPRIKFNDSSLGSFDSKQVISRPDLATYPNSPMSRRSNGSALVAFMTFADQLGFREVG